MADDTTVSGISFQRFDGRHFQHTEQYAAAVDALFARAISEIAAIAAKEKVDPDKPFTFADYPNTRAAVVEIVSKLARDVKAVVSDGSRNEWL